MKEIKIVGQKYPSSCLRDYKTGLPLMLEHTENSDAIRAEARESAKQLLDALADPTGLTPI